MQHVSPNSPALSLDALCAGVIALRRNEVSFEAIVLMVEIDRLVARSVQPDAEILRRVTGWSKLLIWRHLDEAEKAGLIRSRHVRRLGRLALTVTPAGRVALDDAAKSLAGAKAPEATHGASDEETADELPAPVRMRNRPPRMLAAVR